MPSRKQNSRVSEVVGKADILRITLEVWKNKGVTFLFPVEFITFYTCFTEFAFLSVESEESEQFAISEKNVFFL